MGGAITGPLYSAMGIQASEGVESVGVMLNQMARIVVYDGKMSQDDLEFMDHMLSIEKYKEAYRPCVVDLLKWDSEFDTDFVNTHMREFIMTYVSMAIKNPRLALEGWEMTTYGYWVPNRWELFYDSANVPKGNLKDLAASGLNVETVNLLANGKFDVTSVIKNTGSIFYMAIINWFVLLAFICMVSMRRKKEVIALLPSVGLFLTLLIASPYYYWQRYGLAQYYLLPIYVYIFINGFQRESKKEYQEQGE